MAKIDKKTRVLFKLVQDEDGYPPISVESIWTTRHSGGFVIDNIPFYAYGVAPGDLISVKSINDETWFDELLKIQGASVFRAFFKKRIEIEKFRTDLVALRCSSEVDLSMGLVSLVIPALQPAEPVIDCLLRYQELGICDFEEGVLHHQLS